MGTLPKRGLALEGGGVLAPSHLGVLRKLHDWQLLSNFTHFSGSSSGAIVAGLLACRAPMETLNSVMGTVDFASFKDDDWGIIRDIYRLFTKHGWYKGKVLQKWYRGVLAKLTGDGDITLGAVHARYKTYLVVTVTEVFDSGMETVAIDHVNFPDMPLWQAIRMSASFPVVFRSVFLTDAKGHKHEYIDGGTLYNYPIGLLDKVLPPEQVIGVKLISTQSEGSAVHTRRAQRVRVPPKSFKNYAMALIVGMRSQALRLHVKENDWLRTIHVDVGAITSTQFDLTEKDIAFLIAQGEHAAEAQKSVAIR